MATSMMQPWGGLTVGSYLVHAWTHVTGKTTDCYVSNIRDETLRPGEATCSQRCMIAGIGNDHASTYDVKMKDYELAR